MKDMNDLSKDQLDFLKRHNIELNEVFNAKDNYKSAIMKSFTKFKIVLGLILIAIPIIALTMWFIESSISSSIISRYAERDSSKIVECWAVTHHDSYGKVQLLLGLCGVAGAILVSSSKIDIK